jgi:FMN-dependent oxidoreductase (nitrilotriacetate monooxygenase family)
VFHLGLICLPAQPNITSGSWRHPHFPVSPDFTGQQFWKDVAKTAEQAKFDFIFCADTEGIFAEYGNSRDGALKEGKFVPAYDQTVMADYMAAVTDRIGIIATISTTASQPFLLARRLATMDILSEGRIAWNIVTSTHKGGVRGVGLPDLPPHDERYDRADEFVDLCKMLWNSWDDGAIVADVERDMFIDPSKVHDVFFEGKYFRSYAPLNVQRSPQGGPLLVQAGASPRGLAFAAKHAEMIFAIQPNKEGMRRYYEQAREAIVKAGRDPERCRIMYAMHMFVGDTEAEAREKRQWHRDLMTPERALVSVSGIIGVDLSQVDPLQPLTEVKIPGAQSHVEAWARTGISTLHEVALKHESGAGPEVVGTPQQIADWMCETMDFVGGDGFMFEPRYLPHDFKEFVTKVLPILQDRGAVRTDYDGQTLRENVLAF